MAVKKRELGKIIQRYEFLDVRDVPTYEGYGKKRRVKTSTIAIFHAKHKIKDGFKNPLLAMNFIQDNFNKYDKKNRVFK